MIVRPNTRSKRRRLSAFLICTFVVVLVGTYGTWGYERHLAIESFPVAGAEINPKFQFAIEYRKRFDFLPGARLTLVAVDRDDIAEVRSMAVAAYDWSIPDLRGTTYCFVADYEPLPGWKQRDPRTEPMAAELN